MMRLVTYRDSIHIGWVVKTDTVNCVFPGYKYLRKIVYTEVFPTNDVQVFASDLYNKLNCDNIIYPIFDFSNHEQGVTVKDEEIVVDPITNIGSILKDLQFPEYLGKKELKSLKKLLLSNKFSIKILPHELNSDIYLEDCSIEQESNQYKRYYKGMRNPAIVHKDEKRELMR